jgi:flagellar biosynthesis GTPase FlhF
MTEYVFRASDTDTAMEKAIRELGDDAMILSVKRVGDVTEVRAVKEVSVVNQPVWENLRSQSLPTEAVDLGAALRRAREQRSTLQQPAQLQAAPLSDARAQSSGVVEPRVDIEFGFSSVGTVYPTEQVDLPTEQVDLAISDAKQIIDATQLEKMFRQRLEQVPEPVGRPLTGQDTQNPTAAAQVTQVVANMEQPMSVPSDHQPLAPYGGLLQDGVIGGADGQPGSSLPSAGGMALPDLPRKAIFSYGFPEDIALACAVAPDLHTQEAQRDHACKMLAQRLATEGETSVVHEDCTLFVFGPPGGGKTTVAAQLAFERLQSTASRPRFVQLAHAGYINDTRLERYASLLNAEFRHLSLNTTVSITHADVIDCDFAEPSAIVDALEWVTEQNANGPVTPVMVIPGTWSVSAIKQYSHLFEGLSPATILTHMNIGGIDAEGLGALAEAQVTLIGVNESSKITDGLMLVDALSVEQFLKDNFVISSNGSEGKN